MALKGSDVVDAHIDATTSRPDALAAQCVENGVVFIEGRAIAPPSSGSAHCSPRGR